MDIHDNATKGNRHKAILDLLRERKSCTIHEIAAQIGVRRQHVYHYLSKLLEQEKVVVYYGLVWLRGASEFLNHKEIAHYLGITPDGVWTWQRKGWLKRAGKQKMLSKGDLIEFLGKYRVGSPIKELPVLMKKQETLRLLNLQQNTFDKWRRQGLPYFQVKRTVLVARDELFRFVRGYIAKPPNRSCAREKAEKLQKALIGLEMPNP